MNSTMAASAKGKENAVNLLINSHPNYPYASPSDLNFAGSFPNANATFFIYYSPLRVYLQYNNNGTIYDASLFNNPDITY